MNKANTAAQNDNSSVAGMRSKIRRLTGSEVR